MTDGGAQHHSREAARTAKAQVAEELAGWPGVVGLGLERQQDGGWRVRVNVTSREVAQAVRRQFSGRDELVAVQVRIVGEISAAGEP